MKEVVKSEPITYPSKERQKAWWKKISIHKPGFDVLSGTCFLLILMHLFIISTGGLLAHESVYNQWLGLKSESLLEGKVWQLVTYSFLHGNWIHLLSNVVMIWLIGGRLMTILDQKKVALCLLLGTVVGGVFFVIFDLFNGQRALLVGASGSAFALFILLACLSPNAKIIPIPVRAKNMAIGVLLASLILCLAHPGLNIPLFSSLTEWFDQMRMLSVFQIAHACHLGGGIAGFLISRRVMGKMISLEDLKQSRIH